MSRRVAIALAVLASLAFLAAALPREAFGPRERVEAAAAHAPPAANSTLVEAPRTSLHVAVAQRFPDPAVLAVGNQYYAYATRNGRQNIPVMLSTDLARWTLSIDALPQLPAWAAGRTWAPAVVQRGDRYVLWYTARDRASARQCISVATADGPLGPFSDSTAAPAICQLELGGSIDPEVFVDDGGDAYLLWKSEDNALGQRTTLWAAPLSADGTAIGAHTRLISGGPGWHSNLVEGPAMVAHGGTYYLFYGANRWNTAAAAIGYAVCESPLGPCADATSDTPWLANTETAFGPSGPNIFKDSNGALRFAYHAWEHCIGGFPCNRALYFGTLSFTDGRPQLGPVQ
jgi:beta-xylosidase